MDANRKRERTVLMNLIFPSIDRRLAFSAEAKVRSSYHGEPLIGVQI